MRAVVDTIVSWGPAGVFLLALLDSAGVPLPAVVDALIMLLSAHSPERAFLVGTLATLGSLAGSMLLYWLARRGGEAYLARHTLKPRTIRLRLWFQHYGLLTVFIAGISPLPLPLKLFVISSGALGIKPLPFFLTVLCARVPRYAALAYLGSQLGTGATEYLRSHAWEIGGILAALFAVLFVAVKISDRRRLRSTGTV